MKLTPELLRQLSIPGTARKVICSNNEVRYIYDGKVYKEVPLEDLFPEDQYERKDTLQIIDLMKSGPWGRKGKRSSL